MMSFVVKAAPLLWIALAAICSAAHSVSEQRFEQSYREDILPYFETGEFGFFPGEDGASIAYAALKATSERGACVILPGKSESILKYAELVYDLRASGYSFYLMDHRGMGLSSSLLGGERDKCHIERFEDYVRDLGTFIDQVVNAQAHPARVLLGHSMGGIVAMLYAESHPGAFDGVILCAPMLRVVTHPLPEALAGVMCECAVPLGLGERYCPTRGPWELLPFEGNPFTQSRARWSLWEEHLIPSRDLTGMGGPTLRWLREGMRAGRRAGRDAGEIRVPVLLFQAGLDTYVKPRAQEEACDRMPNCELVRYPVSRHEILMERDSIRDSAVEEIRGFLGGISSRVAASLAR